LFRIRNYLPTKTVRTATDILKDYKGMIADIACGKGVLLKEIEKHNNKKIIGIDSALDQITNAKNAGMSVLRGDILRMPYKNSIFDVAVCLNTIYNFSSLSGFEPAFIEMIRIIKKDGKIIIDIRNRRNLILRFKYWRRNRKMTFPTIPYIPEDIINVMNATGCRLIREKAVGINNQYLAWGYIMVFEKNENME
jgi:SAM-dependent methyltransferase